MYIPQLFKEISFGVYERKRKGDPLSAALEAHYESEAIRILESDFIHYSGLRKYLAGYLPELLSCYKKAIAVGGGSPKLESLLLQTREIIIMDGFVDIYKLSDSQFRTIYHVGNDVNIEYLHNQLDCPFKVPAADNSCVTFIHFLEHCINWETVCSWIENQENDIVIYGPNIVVATDDNWFHFSPVDHNVFFTTEAIAEVGKQCGYSINSLSYSDDMLVWMRRPGNIQSGAAGADKAMTLREKLLFVVYCLIEEIKQIRIASLNAETLLESGKYQAGCKIIMQKIIPSKDKVIELFSEVNRSYDISPPQRKQRLDNYFNSLNGLCSDLAQLTGAENFDRAAFILRHDFPAITKSSLLLNRLRNTLIASGDTAMEEKIR